MEAHGLTLLAVAGLNRLKQAHLIQSILEPDVMLPAVAQGAIGVEVRDTDAKTKQLLAAVHCHTTELRVTAERAFLKVMDGSCRTPLAALMQEPDPHGRARFDVLAAAPDGSSVKKLSYMMTVSNTADAQKLGEQAGREMKAILPENYRG